MANQLRLWAIRGQHFGFASLLILLLHSGAVNASNIDACRTQLQKLATLDKPTLQQGLARENNRRITILENEQKQVGLFVAKTNTKFKDLRAEPLILNENGFEARTMMFYHKDGIIPADAKALVVLLHGIGADISHSGAMLPVMNFLAGPKTGKQKGSTARIHEKHIPLGVVAIDGPGNGYGPSLEAIPNLDKAIQLLRLELQALKAKAPELPLIVFARSASTGMMVELNRRFPELIDGLILMSPVTPEPAAMAQANEGLAQDLAEAAELRAKGLKADFVPLMPVLDWDSKLYNEMSWYQDQQVLGEKPTLVIVGSEDRQTPSKVREFYRSLVQVENHSQNQFLLVEGAGHDVVSITPRFPGDVETEDRAIATYHRVYEFIGSVVGTTHSR